MKCCLSVYLERTVMTQLTDLAKRKKKSMSLVAETAIVSFLTPDESDRREAAIARRLDRLTRQTERLERDLTVSVEAMALFIRYWLTVTPPIPEDFQAAAHAKGRERFASFLKMLGRRLASGTKVFQEIPADVSFDGSVTKPSQK